MLKTNVFIVNTIKTNIRCLSFEIFDLNDSKTCVFVYIFSHMYKFHYNSASPYHYRYTDKNPSRLYPTFQKAIPHFVLFKISLYYPRNNISPRNTSFVVCQTYKCLLIGGILSILKNKQGGYLWKAVLAMFVVYCIHILELKESFFI